MSFQPLKRKHSLDSNSEQPPTKISAVSPQIDTTLVDLPSDCIAHVFKFTDLRTRLKGMRVAKSLHAVINRYGVLPISTDILSLKQASILEQKEEGNHFLLNNDAVVEKVDLPKAVAWAMQRYSCETFEFVMEYLELGAIVEDMFARLANCNLKQLRIIFRGVFIQPLHCQALPKLLRQCAGSLESLCLEVAVSKRLFNAIDSCRRLRSLAFEGRCPYQPDEQLTWPDLPLLKQVYLDGMVNLHRCIERHLRARWRAARPYELASAYFYKHANRVDFTSTAIASSLPDSDCLFGAGGSANPRLETVLIYDTDWELGCVRPVALDDAAASLLDLFERHAAGNKSPRRLLLVMPTRPSRSAVCELRSVLPAFRWAGAAPTPADDDQWIAQLAARALEKGVAGLAIRRVVRDQLEAADDAARHLAATLRSRRQFELSSATLTVRLVLLSDYDTSVLI